MGSETGVHHGALLFFRTKYIMMSTKVQPPTLPPPPLQPLNVNAENMVEEFAYWKRGYECFVHMAKLGLTADQDKLDVLWAYIGRDTEDYLRNLPNFSNIENSVNDLLTAITARYTKSPKVL